MSSNQGGGSHLITLFVSCWIQGSHSGGHEEFYLLGYNAVQSGESQQRFRRNITPPSSGLKSKTKTRMKLPGPCCLFHDGFWLGIPFEAEDGGDMLLRYVH
jgi:hypothetical protein